MAFAYQRGRENSGQSSIWNGVYTTAQAARGKDTFQQTCSSCHNVDLNGSARAPALRGDGFLKHWDNGSTHALFVKMRDSMPENSPEAVSEQEKVDILAYLLQANGFPAGKTELSVKEIDNIQIVQKGAQATPNFALVRVVGCLTPGSGRNWALTQSTEPALTREDKPTTAELQDAAQTALGAAAFQLLNTVPFKPASLAGQKVEARGLLYRDSGRDLLNLTALESTGANCGN